MTSPPTEYICYLLQSDRTNREAWKKARELGISKEWAGFWWKNCRGQGGK